MRKYKFQDFRTVDAITNALFWYCDAITTPKGFRAQCPHRDCVKNKRRTLVCYTGGTVAHCYKCNRTYDALSIVVMAERISLFEACEKLQHFIG